MWMTRVLLGILKKSVGDPRDRQEVDLISWAYKMLHANDGAPAVSLVHGLDPLFMQERMV